MPSSRAARKRQSRLSFTPLPSSSPASKEYHKQIRDRAATVTIEGSMGSSKRRKAQNDDDDDSDLEIIDATTTIPTPAASLQKSNAPIEIESDEDPIPATQRQQKKPKLRTRPRQQQLDFTSTRDPDSFDSPVRLPSSSVRTTRSSRPGMFSSQANGNAIELSSDNESDASNELPSPRKEMEKLRKKSGKGKERESRRATTRQLSAVEEDDESDEIAVRARPTQRTQEQSEDDDDDDDMPTTAGKKPRRRREPSRDSFISDSPPPAVESDEDDVVIVDKRSRKRSGQDTESDEEDEDDLPKTPGRRRLKRQRQMTQQERKELAEDIEFLEPSDEEPTRKPRSTQSAQKNARQQALEKLKRNRSSQPVPVDEENEESGEAAEDDNEDEAEQEYEQLDDDDDDESVPQASTSRQMFTRNDDDDGFIEEEGEDSRLGVPEGIPLEFTRYASMKPKELFKFAVEWMVQRKINPAFQMDDDIYKLTFKKLDDEVSGLANSKFTSTSWVPSFVLALKARPDIAYEALDRTSEEHFMRDKCDACNRSGHPATFAIQFQGKPYHHSTLEPVSTNDEDEGENESSDEDDASDDEEEADWDAAGREIAPVSTIWYVGRFCKLNAETAHALHHWRHHLNGFVEGYLDNRDYNTAEEVVKRDRWSTKKRRKYANKIVDRMEQEGEVKALWKQFRQNIEDARNSKQGRFEAASP